MTILEIAFPIFLMMDPIGNVPLYISSLKNVALKRQKWVILRELIIALLIIILFNFVGGGLFRFLKISKDAVQISGGIILFLIALKMIFPIPKHQKENPNDEPFIVPLAVPLIAGPSVLAAVMLYSQQTKSSWVMIAGISVAWAASLVILLLSSTLSKLLKEKGITACERLMGLILVMIGIQMFLEGIAGFVRTQCL